MNPIQKAAVRRKSFYLAAIVSLLTLSIFYRGLEAKTPEGTPYVWIPFGRDNPTGPPGAADKMARQTIISQSRRLELRELEIGEPDLTGEAVRLAVTGLRGFAVTLIWMDAIEQQKRNDYHKFEQSIKAVTMLQPHFIAPWVFQSWNVAYNVSVEMHSLGDMYFYIARGIDLGAEGERRNRHSPDLRYWIGFYYQNKFGVADQVQTLRCLFQLSCMPPDERNHQNYLDADGNVRMDDFKRFCEKHPMLVRRLRGEERYDLAKVTELKRQYEGLRMTRPEDVVRFLRENRTVPSRYKNATELYPFDRQFPVLPPQFAEGRDEAHPRSSAEDLTESFSGYRAARAWFSYANVLVPPNPKDDFGRPIPCQVPPDYDLFKYRMPKQPARILFLQAPPRAQSYQAEMLEKDGWFDTDGWEVDAGIDDANAWFPKHSEVQLVDVVGTAGSFNLSFNGQTATIAAGAAPAAVQSALNALASIKSVGSVAVSAEPLPNGTRYVVSFNGGGLRNTNVSQLTGVGVSDNAPTVAISTRQDGVAPAIFGGGVEWAQTEWQKAYEYWSRHGEQYGLTLQPSQIVRYRSEAGLPPDQENVPMPRDATEQQMADPAFARRYKALSGLFYYQVNRAMSNFPYFLATAQGERHKETVEARKTLWKAYQMQRVGENFQAAKLYQRGLELWRGVLARNPSFHRPERLTTIEEQTFEFELEFLRLMARSDPLDVVRKQALKDYQAEVAAAARPAAAVIPFGVLEPKSIPRALQDRWWSATAEKHFAPFAGTITAQDVAAGDPRIGTPWIQADIKKAVLQAQGIMKNAIAPARTPKEPLSTGSPR